jgi:hypothetical protein
MQMANSREYAYFIKGSKLAIVERDRNDTSGLTSPSSVPSVELPNQFSKWKSPQASVTDGIEIEYAYTPEYSLPNSLTVGVNYFGFNGYTIVDGYLTFIRSMSNLTASPFSSIAAGEHIYIKNSNKWNGVHKVQEVQSALTGSHGGVKTYTKVNQDIKTITDIGGTVDWNYSITVYKSITAMDGIGAGIDTVFSEFGTNTEVPYIWITGSAGQINNNNMYSGWEYHAATNTLYLRSAGSAVNGLLYGWNYPVDLTPIATDADYVGGADTNVNLYIREAFYDPCILYSDVAVMTDESDSIDVPSYLSKALVYYVKSKMAEDIMELEMSIYWRTQFTKMLEKHESSKVAGPRRVMPGSGTII